MANKYFTYDINDGIKFFDSEEDAKKDANDLIQWYRDNSDDGWLQEVENVIWGKVEQQSQIISKEPYDPEKHNSQIAEIGDDVIDYGLVNVSEVDELTKMLFEFGITPKWEIENIKDVAMNRHGVKKSKREFVGRIIEEVFEQLKEKAK